MNFPFLERLKLKTIIYLAPEEPSEKFIHFVQDEGIELIHLGKESSSTPWKPTSEDVVVGALRLLLNNHNYPIHVMCKLGRHRTGTLIGCLRKLQQWNLASIIAEYRRYAGAKVRTLNEQFIDLFDVELVSYNYNGSNDNTTVYIPATSLTSSPSFQSSHVSLEIDIDANADPFMNVEQANHKIEDDGDDELGAHQLDSAEIFSRKIPSSTSASSLVPPRWMQMQSRICRKQY